MMYLDNLLTAAAFMSAGAHQHPQFSKALEVWDAGCLELIDDLSSYAVPAIALWDASRELANGCHGVVDYDVFEPFGFWYVERVLEYGKGGNYVKEEDAFKELRRSMIEFYKGRMGEDVILWQELYHMVMNMPLSRKTNPCKEAQEETKAEDAFTKELDSFRIALRMEKLLRSVLTTKGGIEEHQKSVLIARAFLNELDTPD